MPDPDPIDTSVKSLFRRHHRALFRLLGIAEVEIPVLLEDTAVNLPELRADQVFVFKGVGDPARGAVYFEYVLHPDPRKHREWQAKRTGLEKQLDMPVVLVALYLERGRRATFPDEDLIEVMGIPNRFQFARVLFWEYGDRIRSGEFPEFAPLLVLCEDNPTEQTVRQEVRLIRESGLPAGDQADLLAIAVRVAGRDLPRTMLEGIFREIEPMLRGNTFIDDWIAEAAEKAEARGEARGRDEGVRETALRVLEKRFGRLPEALHHRIEQSDAEGCRTLLERAFEATSVADLLE